MLSFLFWNLNGNATPAMHERIRRLAKHFDVDVFVFVESDVEPTIAVQALCEAENGEYHHSLNECERVQCFHRLRPDDIVDQFSSPDERMAIRRLFLQQGEVLFVALHAPSQLHLSRDEIKDAIYDYQAYISQTERMLSLHRTIVVGDMNLNPFDEGMVSSHGFHAVMTMDVARRAARKVYGTRRAYFYNPMWGLFGDRSHGPPGTYHYAKAGSILYYWNMFDQVLLRPELMDDLHELKILDTDGEESLVTKNGLPNPRTASDHLPILIRLRLDAKED